MHSRKRISEAVIIFSTKKDLYPIFSKWNFNILNKLLFFSLTDGFVFVEVFYLFLEFGFNYGASN
jgi:hypothetical protein